MNGSAYEKFWRDKACADEDRTINNSQCWEEHVIVAITERQKYR
jgi:hypothetical protein